MRIEKKLAREGRIANKDGTEAEPEAEKKPTKPKKSKGKRKKTVFGGLYDTIVPDRLRSRESGELARLAAELDKAAPYSPKSSMTSGSPWSSGVGSLKHFGDQR